MTVRNIRAHQARGLLPPPRVAGRVGWYGPAHRRRLEQIRAMQDEGLNLAAIAKVLNDGQITAMTTEVFRPTEPAWFSIEELVSRLGIVDGDGSAERAMELGLIDFDDDRIRMDTPALLRVAEEFLALGVPLTALLEVFAQVQRATRDVARAYLELADEHLVARVAVDASGDLEAMRPAITRLRDLARTGLVTSFDQAMSEELRAYFEMGGAEEDPSTS